MFKPQTGKIATAWIEESRQNNFDVAVHHFFQHRLDHLREMLSKNSTSMKLRSTTMKEREIRIIVVFIGMAILHEVAHLMIRLVFYHEIFYSKFLN